jgi:hypothetical protein
MRMSTGPVRPRLPARLPGAGVVEGVYGAAPLAPRARLEVRVGRVAVERGSREALLGRRARLRLLAEGSLSLSLSLMGPRGLNSPL